MNSNPFLDPALRETIGEHLQELLESASLSSAPPTMGTAGVWQLLRTFWRSLMPRKPSREAYRTRKTSPNSPCHDGVCQNSSGRKRPQRACLFPPVPFHGGGQP